MSSRSNSLKRVILISCSSKKLKHKSKAEDLYVSTLFKLSLAYAKKLQPHKIFILSAKYGLLELGRRIEPYNQTLNKMPAKEIRKWAEKVIKSLSQKADPSRDEFIFLAGEKYRKYLIGHIVHCKVPLLGLGIGNQLKYLKSEINDE